MTTQEIKKKSHTLKEAWASNEIEGIHVAPQNKRFIENLVLQGLSSDEVVAAYKKHLGIEERAT
ncbi:uncharacterized protein DFE_A0028 (plasmid) [Desulfovibrio ferrophilus]|uniref:Antitoxin VbhA domain-containing protein n=1 Tax=Desulfovibrio ferrophilus TaxID=241368 RepID=A0A2Z6B3P1_9BACT|nr:uncharacterized protein DFE_A0028 [Desulfovibrio ferrophilus]